MSTQFSFTRSADGTETIVVIGTQGVRVVPDSHANYNQIKNMLLEPDLYSDRTEDDLFALTDAQATVEAKLARLSGRVMIKGDTIYFDGDPVDTRLSRQIVDMIRNEDENYAGYVAFLENLQANPSEASRESLFAFLEGQDLVITEDGCFIGYKAIRQDGKSVTTGKEDVTVTMPDGTVEVHKGHIPNPVGAIVEMPRSLVDPDQATACSVGLHIGTHHFATHWSPGSKFLTVKVNPRDVVSVPIGETEKLRAHRYTVLEENEGRTKYTGTSYLGNPGNTLDEDEDYQEDDWGL